jgi:hypothetical protein
MDRWVRAARPLAPALAGALLLAACTPGASAAREEAAARSIPAPVAPTFEPAPDATTDEASDAPPEVPAEVPADDAVDAAPAPAPTGPDPAAAPPDRPAEERPSPDPTSSPRRPEAVPATTSSVIDPRGDTSQPVLGRAPAAADLIHGRVRSGDADVIISIELGAPPEADRSTTLNVASFHDLTGDGAVDLEVWANHSEAGWFPSWRDNRAGRAAYGRTSGITVAADGATVTLTVPADRFGDATSWRWALGLEWGRYEWLGTQAAARDAAPDEGYVTHGP